MLFIFNDLWLRFKINDILFWFFVSVSISYDLVSHKVCCSFSNDLLKWRGRAVYVVCKVTGYCFSYTDSIYFCFQFEKVYLYLILLKRFLFHVCS